MNQQGVEKTCSQTGQKGPRCEAREKSTSAGVLRQYVGATLLGAGMIPAAIKRDYRKRLLRAGWRHMGLFQRSDQNLAPSPVMSTRDYLLLGDSGHWMYIALVFYAHN
jgi:hypothetical protein